jgi:hypothetical protein
MPPKKRKQDRPTAKSAKKGRQRTPKAKAGAKSAEKQRVRKRVGSRPRVRSRTKAPSARAKTELKREFQGRGLTAASTALPPRSEDFEGASRAQQTDSESVDGLVEEGNLFEAGAVAGVQEADAADEREVHTRELPEDEVPEEYLDKDRRRDSILQF